MDSLYTAIKFIKLGLDHKDANVLAVKLARLPKNASPFQARAIICHLLSQQNYPFPVHLRLFSLIYPNWQEHPEQAPAWIVSPEEKKTLNIQQWMTVLKIDSVENLHRWSVQHYPDF